MKGNRLDISKDDPVLDGVQAHDEDLCIEKRRADEVLPVQEVVDYDFWAGGDHQVALECGHGCDWLALLLFRGREAEEDSIFLCNQCKRKDNERDREEGSRSTVR